MNKINNKKTVFVGVSGGVDSSVSLALLKDEGYNVVGVFIKTWQPDWIECTWRDEKRDAMRVCAHLDVPFLFFDFEEEYKRGVADYMVNEYKIGRTPNPDVMCNREIKFGAFYNKAISMGADYVATGHYARIKDGELYVGKDDNKDQSYFLWMIEKEQLNKILFPIGHLKKSEVRKLAENYDLPTARKKDSQGICFIGEVDMKEFLAHYIPIEKGNVLDISGEIIGHHNGALFYTFGERHGFVIDKKGNNDVPLYVLDKDLKNNTITVGEEKRIHNFNNKKKMKIKLSSINILSEFETKKIQFRSRYRQDLAIGYFDGTELCIDFIDRTLAFGQSIVLYEDDRVIGGGIIDQFDFV